MPPHCDSMDGPVVKAAMEALESADVRAVLPFVPEEGEPEVTEAFEKVIKARVQSPEAREVADCDLPHEPAVLGCGPLQDRHTRCLATIEVEDHTDVFGPGMLF